VTLETREGWPLLTVEPDGNSKSANERGNSLVLVHWASRAGTKYGTRTPTKRPVT